jgi:hypothetical protein
MINKIAEETATENHGIVVSTPTSYSEGPGIELQSRDGLSLSFSWFFCNLFR